MSPQPTHDKFDVLVVGGGPAGLAAAHRAAAGGASALCVHRDAEIGRPVRTSGGSYLRDVQRLGVPQHLYQRIDELVFAGPTRTARIDVSDQPMVVLDITGTYRWLASLAADAGAVVETGCQFISLRRTADHNYRYRCTLESASGRRDVAARYLVEASGSSRAVLAALGQSRRVSRLGAGIEYECKYIGDAPHRATLFVGDRFCPAGYGWIFPTVAGSVRVGLGVLRPQQKAKLPELIDAFMQSDMARQLDVGAGEIIDRHVGVVPADGVPERLVHDRVVVAGDAASMAIATVGEGIRYCIDAGRAAGDAIATAVQTGDDRSLEIYERNWMKQHRRNFRFGQRINVALGGYSDADWDRSLALISQMRSREIQALLRAELSPAVWLKFGLRHPHGVWRVLRRAIAPDVG